MSLNDIELPDSVITALYGNSLLITAPSPVAPIHPPAHAPAYKFLGNNQKNITVLVDSPGTAYLPDDQLTFLTKMLEACKMNIGDVAIVNHAATPANIAELKMQLAPARFLLFGPGPDEIGMPIHFPSFRIQTYDQCSFLWAPALAAFVQTGEESKLLKTKLWACLRLLFGL